MRVLVTGTSGFVGRHLVAALRNGHNTAIPFARGKPAPDGGFAGPSDLADIDRWPDWPAGIDVLVHLAAMNPARGERPSPNALRHANVVGTAKLADRARRERVRRMVFVSTANVHAPGGAQPIRETDRLEPQSDYARSKGQAEEIFWKSLSGSDTEGCVLRPAPVYGRGAGGSVMALARLARLLLPLPVGGVGGARSILSVAHLVDAITLCLDAPGAAGETFLVADEGALTYAEMIRAMRQGWSRRPWTIPLPYPTRAFVEAGTKMIPTLNRLLAPFALDTSHLSESTGWKPPLACFDALSAAAARGEL